MKDNITKADFEADYLFNVFIYQCYFQYEK